MAKLRPLSILDIPVHPVTLAETLTRIHEFMSEPRLHQIATVNPEFVMTAQSDPAFKAVLKRADLCVPDGVGLLWAARQQGTLLPERVPGSELIYHVAALAAAQRWRLFLLGAGPGVAAEAAAKLKAAYPGLRVVATYEGSPAAAENQAITDRINASGAEVLLVAYGAPQQDLWIDRNRDQLPTVRLALGVGGAFDFVTGRTQRAPQWLQNLGLEWFHRLVREPWRWRRMLALPRFVWLVLRSGRNVP